MDLLSHHSTLFILLFLEQNLLHRQSLWRFFLVNFLCQVSSNRLYYFNFLCLFSLNNRIYFSLGYYFIKLIGSYYHRLGFFNKRWRILFLYLENFLENFPKEVFSFDFFCYGEHFFASSIIIPFKYYFLRFDIYSFFFLWSAVEAIRICLYNSYINSHPALYSRPHLRRCFLQGWFPRRRGFTILRGLPQLNLKPFDLNSLRQFLSERFSIMLFHRKYIILNIIQSKSFRFRRISLPFSMTFCFQKNPTFYWLLSLSKATFSISGLLSPWHWAEICRIFFLYFMQHPKRYGLDRWRLERYFHYFTRSLLRIYSRSELFILRSLKAHGRRFTQRLYRQFFFSDFLQNAFLLQDLYNYPAFLWEAFLSFIDRHFCYRILSFKYNLFFDTYFLKGHGNYMNVTFSLLRPLSRKPTPTAVLPRRRTFFFARRFLLRFCLLPSLFASTLLGLEYFYWRIVEYAASAKWLQHRLPLFYYYLKLNIDQLMLSRYYSFTHLCKNSSFASLSSIYNDFASSFSLVNTPIFSRQRWSLPMHLYDLNPWILFNFSALKSISLQSLNGNLPFSLIAFYLLKRSHFFSLQQFFAEGFFSRSIASLENAKVIHNFFFADRFYQDFKADLESPRAHKWLAHFLFKKSSTLPYATGYSWLRANKSPWMDY